MWLLWATLFIPTSGHTDDQLLGYFGPLCLFRHLVTLTISFCSIRWVKYSQFWQVLENATKSKQILEKKSKYLLEWNFFDFCKRDFLRLIQLIAFSQNTEGSENNFSIILSKEIRQAARTNERLLHRIPKSKLNLVGSFNQVPSRQ